MNIPNEVVKQNINMDISPEAFAAYEAIVRDCAKTVEDMTRFTSMQTVKHYQMADQAAKAILSRYGLEPKP